MSELSNPEFWVGFGFCLVITCLCFLSSKKVKIWGKQQADLVKKELDDALSLRMEAEALYDSYAKRTKNLEKEKAAIIQEAEKEVVLLQQEADDKLSKKIERKKQDIQDRINMMEQNAQKDLTQTMMNQVMEKTKSILTDKKIRQSSMDMDESLNRVLDSLENVIKE